MTTEVRAAVRKPETVSFIYVDEWSAAEAAKWCGGHSVNSQRYVAVYGPGQPVQCARYGDYIVSRSGGYEVMSAVDFSAEFTPI